MTKRKYPGWKGHGDGYHDSAVYTPDKKLSNIFNNIASAIAKDRRKARENNNILVVEENIPGLFGQICIFCPPNYLSFPTKYQKMEKIKDNYWKCPKCGFIKIKRGIKIKEAE